MSSRVYGDAPMQQRPPLIGSRRAGFLARARVCGASPWILGSCYSGHSAPLFGKPENRSRVPLRERERYCCVKNSLGRVVQNDASDVVVVRAFARNQMRFFMEL